MGGDQRSLVLKAQADLIRRTYEAKPELSLHELRARLAECGSGSAACPASSSATASREKTAAGQDPKDLKAAHLTWFESQLDLDPDRLVFLD